MKVVTLQVASLGEVKRRVQEELPQPQTGCAHHLRVARALVQAYDCKTVRADPRDGRRRPADDRAPARRVNRDVKAVHGDVHALLKAGVLQKISNGNIVFPFDAIRVDVTLHAA